METISSRFLELLLDSSKSTSELIRLVMANNSEGGRFLIADKHPSNRELSKRMGISTKSVSRVISFLCKRGLLKRGVRRELYVTPYMFNTDMEDFTKSVHKEMWDSNFTITKEEAILILSNKMSWKK